MNVVIQLLWTWSRGLKRALEETGEESEARSLFEPPGKARALND